MSCPTGKQAYPDRAIAKRVSKRMKRNRLLDASGHQLPVLRPYRCHLCGEYHLTKTVNSPTRRGVI